MLLSNKKIQLLKKEYDTKGYTVVKNIFDKSVIGKAGEDLENHFLDSLSILKGRNINRTKNNIINSIHFMNHWRWSKKFKNDKNLKKISKTFLEESLQDFGSELFAKPANVGLASPMHQDNYYWCIDNSKGLTIWIALDDSSKKNGGVFYFEKSHKMGLLEHVKSFAPGSSQTLKYQKSMKYFKKSIPNIKKGDCIIHDCLIVHGSHKNDSPFQRRGLTIRYIAKSSRIDNGRKKRYELDLKKSTKR